MSALSVGVLEPGCRGVGALLVAGEHLPVGPFGWEGPVESFDLAVQPGAVGPDQDVGDPGCVEELGEVAASGVAPVVVGHDRLDEHTVGLETCDGPGKEPGAGLALLVGEDLPVQVAAVVFAFRSNRPCHQRPSRVHLGRYEHSEHGVIGNPVSVRAART